MTKQDQIDEMAKYICNVCEMGFSFDGDFSEGGQDSYKYRLLTQETAKTLYDAGYRKVLLDTEDGKVVDCVQYAPWQLIEGYTEREVKKARKETAKEILGMYRLEDTFSSFQAKVMEKYGVEIQND